MDLSTLLRGQALENYNSPSARSFFDLDEETPAPKPLPALPPVANNVPAVSTPLSPAEPPLAVTPVLVDEEPTDSDTAALTGDTYYTAYQEAPTAPSNQPDVLSVDTEAPVLSLHTAQAPASDSAASTGVATLGDSLQKVATGSLSKSISLNQKFRFINQLFNGSADAYNEAVAELDQMTNYGQALDLISYRYANQFMWNMESDEVTELVEILKRRF